MTLLQINGIKEYMEKREKYFNHFKNPIDRSYFIYDIFRYNEGKNGYKVKKLIGSNQVLLYKNDKLIYDRFNETIKQNGPDRFKLWIYQIIKDYIKLRDKND